METALTAPKPRTRHTVTPEPIQNALASILPKRFVDRMIARQLGCEPGEERVFGAPILPDAP